MDLGLQITQKQALSQRMIQSAEILKMTSLELDTYLSELSLENPVIDLAEPAAEGQKDSIEHQQWLNRLNEERHYLYQRQNNDDDYDFKDNWNILADQGEILQDYLWSQLITEDFSAQETEILKFMLECLDNKGYLTEDTADIAAYFHVKADLIERLLAELQALEPAGICARSLQECLKLQLARRNMLTPVLQSVIDDCLDLVARNQIPALVRKFHLSTAEADHYCQIIKSLTPKPGAAFNNRERLHYIIPDVTIVKFKDHFDILLNESMYPGIEINSYYAQLCRQTDSKELKDYLDNKIRQAEWVKQCISQRNKTLLDVSRMILERQEAFFAYGPEHLAPLRLTDIAGLLHIHESTVSRAVSKKYLQCAWGIYPMNFFFSRGVAKRPAGQGEETRAMTARDVKRALGELIAAEDKKKPYSDRALCELLAEKGIVISRRTVAKYRDEEDIPSASGRREYT